MDVKRIDYPDGGWCEQQYVNEKLHGLWTVYYPNGKKKWERQYENDRQEGYQRSWDAAGLLREEQLYHLDQLNGPWRRWRDDGTEEIVNEFAFGKLQRVLNTPSEENSNWHRIHPYWTLEQSKFLPLLDKILNEFVIPACPLTRDKTLKFKDQFGASYFGFINVIGKDEQWPTLSGTPLSPILQIDCDEMRCVPRSLQGTKFITVFALYNDVPQRLGRDIVIRAYPSADSVRKIEPPKACLIDQPHFVSVGEIRSSFPHKNDLPPGLRALIEDENLDTPLVRQGERAVSALPTIEI